MNPLPSLRHALAAAVTLSLALTAPGLPAYAGAANIVAAPAQGIQGPRVVLPVFSAVAGGGTAVPTSAFASRVDFKAFGASTAAKTPSVLSLTSARAVPTTVTETLPSIPLVQSAPAPLRTSPVTVSVPLETARHDAAEALEAVGPVERAAPGDLHGLGERLEAILTGAPALSRSGSVLGAASLRLDPVDHAGNLARPAGDSIRQAAEAHEAEVPAPSGRAPAPQGPRTPFWPKLLAAGLALLPAYFLGLPLIAAGSTLLGGLAVASGVSLAVMPFLGEGAPKFLRATPGAILAAVGVAAVASGFVWAGAFAAVGGWGLFRYGLGQSRLPRYESMESLSAYFGGVAALTGAALAAAHPAGWLAVVVRYGAFPVAALLWLHLPSWVGEGMAAAVEGLYLGAKGLSRVLTAVHRDTNLMERLENFIERHWRSSKWNGVWLAVMWTPVVLVELAKRLLAWAAGVYAGAAIAPAMFLWGASAKLFGEGKAASYFAEAARFAFDRVQNGKAGIFNKAEALVLPWANSDSFPVRLGGSIALTVLQLGWLAYALVAAPLLALAGYLVAFGRMGAYDKDRHAVSSLRINTEDSPGAKPTTPDRPTDPAPAGKAPLAPKLIASALALVPAYYFGVPLFLGTLFHGLGLLYGLLVLPLAAMPFMGPKTPGFIKSLAARGLQYNGLLLFFSGHAILMGLLAFLGGWGFERYVASTRKADKEARFDDSAELGAYFGALGGAVGIGAAWVGLAGPWGWAALGLAAVTSPFLLLHLPEWVFSGVRGAFRGLTSAVSDYADALGFWREDGKFLSNLKKHANYWLAKTYWNGVWLSVIWVPTGLIVAAEYALAVALGVATGLVRAPARFIASGAKNAKPAGRLAIFADAAVEGWRAAAEGSLPLFKAMIRPLRAAIDESTAVTDRPTAKAFLALAAARVVQLLWLAGAIVSGLTAAPLYGAYRGAKAAFAPTQDYRVTLRAIRIDAPLNGENARAVTEKYWNEELDPFFKDLAADFDRSGVKYDKENFVPTKQVDGHGVTLAGDGSDKTLVTMWIVLRLDARQAALVRRHADKMEVAAPAFLASGK